MHADKSRWLALGFASACREASWVWLSRATRSPSHSGCRLSASSTIRGRLAHHIAE